MMLLHLPKDLTGYKSMFDICKQFVYAMILLMEEILHHLGCIKPCYWDKLVINWCRISSINSSRLKITRNKT